MIKPITLKIDHNTFVDLILEISTFIFFSIHKFFFIHKLYTNFLSILLSHISIETTTSTTNYSHLWIQKVVLEYQYSTYFPRYINLTHQVGLVSQDAIRQLLNYQYLSTITSSQLSKLFRLTFMTQHIFYAHCEFCW